MKKTLAVMAVVFCGFSVSAQVGKTGAAPLTTQSDPAAYQSKEQAAKEKQAKAAELKETQKRLKDQEAMQAVPADKQKTKKSTN